MPSKVHEARRPTCFVGSGGGEGCPVIRVDVTPTELDELRARARMAAPRTRNRLEMVRWRWSAWRTPAGRRPGSRANCSATTGRCGHLKAFLADGFAALLDRPRPGRPSRAAEEDLGALDVLFDAGGRTQTARQLGAWLERERGVAVHPNRVGRPLRRRRFDWKRTVASVA